MLNSLNTHIILSNNNMVKPQLSLLYVYVSTFLNFINNCDKKNSCGLLVCNSNLGQNFSNCIWLILTPSP